FSLEKWWDDNYGVKYELTVRSDASWSRNPLTRILLTPTEVDFADFQSDCGDLRVLYAAEDDLVDFYLETCSPPLTVIYIDANVDPLTDQTYYVYGNSTVPATTTSTVMDVRSYLDNLWGYWEMDETSDTSDALAAHGSDLALVTSPPGEAVTLETGRYDGARGEISPTKWFVNDTGIGTWNSNQNATILCWSKITDRAGNNPYYMSIYRSPWSVSGAFGMMSYYDNLNNRAACLLETQGTFATESHSNVNVPENTWHMSSCVFDTTANQHSMCVNNTCGTSEPFGYAGLPSSTEVSIGWADYNGDGLPESGQGSSFTDECGVWRGKAFSTADVDWFYNSGLGRKYPFHYSMPDYVLGPAIR
ncbi:hypothetical protein KY359_04200, partial [Candidatus Woesearchaeota archaeon]|nr:hypothetical protein [Candidatus Woesearchaeota archaeon]